ncbi:glycine--tRNA ligase subunit beta [Alkalihalobacterium bogoriense]|uniref:glycine--tRNA ligase subunit beta n=1 Tax=Alkalihalobacterium bogoriense TaxID=246272 RepID=UPI00047B1EB7|nr:glycine--tRNA ligase subunit beta [Alkalihalobacterium bogoriense]
MNKRDFLLEVGLEEMPARFVTDAMNQLQEKVTNWLTEEQIEFERVEAFSTPRRLAVLVYQLAEKQEDIEEESRGPAKKIAMDEQGNWTKAALGFARGQGVEESQLFFKEVKGTEYVFAKKFIKGQETISVLPKIQTLITSMSFPKNMRWNQYDLRFVRPIQWLVALYGQDIIPIEITNVSADRYTYGHRFLGGKVEIQHPTDYKTTLLGEHVLVQPEDRKNAIRQQIKGIEEERNWTIPVDEGLLEEVTNLVEYPTALFGGFEESFLVLPEEVLITSMREHQRYFPVQSKEGKLLPYFITVRNGDHQHLENVKKGNEKVLRARLSDAEFFYKEDQKMQISDALARLESIVYHEDLGTTGDKVRRIQKIANQLAKRTGVEQSEEVERAAKLCKFDLVTQMVYEFPELQGRMGEEYALKAGESPVVSKAIKEHYMPRFSGDQSPSTLVGTMVSIADKIDTIVSCFSIGLIPTGSQDPYALRRQAAGIVQMVVDHKLSISVEEIIDVALSVAKKNQLLKREEKEIVQDLTEFFTLRMKNLLQEKGVRYDIIDAILVGQLGELTTVVKKADVLMEQVNTPRFKEIVEALSRVTNIAAKAKDLKSIQIDPSLFEKEEEKALFAFYENASEKVEQLMNEGNPTEAFQLLASGQEVIHQYFDNIMVMAKEDALKTNRLSQMKKLADTIESFAQFNAIVFS